MSKLQTQPIGQSPAFLATLDRISHCAALDHTLLVVGERGTGKSMTAGRLHFLSPRWEQSFNAVSCAAYDDEQLEAHIFGEDISAGLIERGEGGTLFLDSIESMSPRVQEKLLRLVEDGEYERLRGDDVYSANIRIIATSGIDLPAAAGAKAFRQDLLDILSTDVITLPPLRRRISDIEALANYFARERVKALKAESFPGFTPEVIAFLEGQDWPGNVRQLRSVAIRAVNNAFLDDNSFDGPIGDVRMDPFEGPWRLAVLHDAPVQTILPPDQLHAPQPGAPQSAPPQNIAPKSEGDFYERVNAFEKTLIVQAMDTQGQHQKKAAAFLGLTYHAFRGQLRKHGLRK
ncbi:sigma 54-interacting transcriptional regulator [Robiginitomaculum antarcticum]|uniref:sigma 54-interacting transcriptional regulator n=1 Tax=Robiginitomaculum antarcticum TaxID=437507 RepID=UPI000379787D|nr:sigma 54-interacting transcriptional regulator [Robiginitomaculum antarcticum]